MFKVLSINNLDPKVIPKGYEIVPKICDWSFQYLDKMDIYRGPCLTQWWCPKISFPMQILRQAGIIL